MSSCDHKTQLHGVCIRCRAFATIASNARIMLEKRKAYMNLLLTAPATSDKAQYELQDAVKDLERSVDFATQSNLWD